MYVFKLPCQHIFIQYSVGCNACNLSALMIFVLVQEFHSHPNVPHSRGIFQVSGIKRNAPAVLEQVHDRQTGGT